MPQLYAKQLSTIDALLEFSAQINLAILGVLK